MVLKINPIGFMPGAFPPGAFPELPIFPVSLDEVKDHLRIDSDDEDFLLVNLILSATTWSEQYQRRYFITKVNIEYFDSFPEMIRPVYSPLSEMMSIDYFDLEGALQTLDSGNYLVDTESQPGRIEPAYGLSWPDTQDVINSVIVTYSAGYGQSDDVPNDIKAAVMMLVQYWYERGVNPSLVSQAKKVLNKKRILTI